MPWTIPDKGEGDHDIQSILFQEYLDVLTAGINGDECVLIGCAVTGGADMTPAVAKGAVLSNGILLPVTAGDVTVTAADGTDPRIDLIVVTSAGAKAVRAGTPAAQPKPPARTANDVVLAAVYVPANDTSIETTKITDLRVLRTRGSVVIYKQTTADVDNNTAAAIHLLNGAGSGLTIPSGLFLAGRILRVRLGGNYLLNSGTPTVRLIVSYGGTTMFSDISGAAIADTDRRAWNLYFDLAAQGNSDQALSGMAQLQDPATAATAPTTGTGDVWGIASVPEGPTPFGGAAAVDSDAADRILAVTFTLSVANAANEVVTEFATVELV